MASRKGKLFPQRPPNVAAEFDNHILAAIKAFEAGKANEGQQKAAFEWIVNKLCDTHALSFRDDQRATDFAEGRRSVGLALLIMLNETPEKKTT